MKPKMSASSALEIRSADPRSSEATSLIRDLSNELARRYDFEEDGSGNFRPEDVLGPRAGFLVGWIGRDAVACGAFRVMEADVAEIKRMFVRPEYRGRGFSKAILEDLERRARACGYRKVRLETGNRQPEAIALYQRSGYHRIPNFGIYQKVESSLCFEKDLAP